MTTMETAVPARKVWAGGLAGLATAAIIYLSQRYLGYALDPATASVAVLAVAKAVAYLVPPAARDKIVELDTELKAAEGAN